MEESNRDNQNGGQAEQAMRFENDKSLKQYNTFGFDQRAERFCEPRSEEDLLQAIEHANNNSMPVFMLGAGSNIVLSTHVSGLVIKLATDSIEYQRSGPDVEVTVEAGANWHALVLDCVAQGLYGLENLALIPGNAGAAPIQNIGAYGVELKDRLIELTAIDLKSGERLTFSNADCQLGYRDSIFKNSLAGQFAITAIKLRLSPVVSTHIEYSALSSELARTGVANPTAKDICSAVCRIRNSKLPDPAVLGNAGSFFKNPIVSKRQLSDLLKKFPDMPHHPVDASRSKLAAGWLVEQAGWKGQRSGRVGVHDRQALVLVNFGEGTGEELLQLAESVSASVWQTYAIRLEQEPTTI